MLYLYVASLVVRLSQLFGIKPKSRTSDKPVIKHIVKDLFKTHKYLLWFTFSHQVQQQIL